MPGALEKSRHQPKWFNVQVLKEERPDLFGAGGNVAFEREEATLMDMFIRDKSDLQTGDLIITHDNLDEEDRHFNRYEVQLKYNEGRYTALYLISRQVCANNETQEKGTLYAMKIGIRPNSANIILRMKRELRVLNELRKNKCAYAPTVLDSGRVADLPFIVMNLLDRNLEKLREQLKTFKPAVVFYIAMEAMAALAFLHSLKYIHRDVKLTNFCIGSGPAISRIFLIDYGDTVKQGKKIRYGTPDVFTLPYWSLDAHTRSAANERGDAESWFYMIADLLSPGCLPWLKMNTEAEVQAAKTELWKEGGARLTANLHIHLLQDVIRTSGQSFDHQLARTIARDGIYSNVKGALMLDWAPSICVNVPTIPQATLDQKKIKIAVLKQNIAKGSQINKGGGTASSPDTHTSTAKKSGSSTQAAKAQSTEKKYAGAKIREGKSQKGSISTKTQEERSVRTSADTKNAARSNERK